MGEKVRLSRTICPFVPLRAYFLVTLIQAVEAKMLRLLYKIFVSLQNVGTLKKSASISLLAEKKRPPPWVLSFGK